VKNGYKNRGKRSGKGIKILTIKTAKTIYRQVFRGIWRG
jgi:hypothetical protein